MNSTPWDYTKANYSTANTNMDDKTKSGIFYLYKESFSKEVPSHLNTNNQNILFHAIGLLCGQYYLDNKDILKAEFANYPMAMKSLNSFFLNEKLQDSLPVKNHSSKNKI